MKHLYTVKKINKCEVRGMAFISKNNARTKYIFRFRFWAYRRIYLFRYYVFSKVFTMFFFFFMLTIKNKIWGWKINEMRQTKCLPTCTKEHSNEFQTPVSQDVFHAVRIFLWYIYWLEKHTSSLSLVYCNNIYIMRVKLQLDNT